MKKMKQWMVAAILICSTTIGTLTSCSSDEIPDMTTTPLGESDVQKAVTGLHFDMSGIVQGNDCVRVWDFKSNNRFTAYDFYTDDDGEFAVDTISGSWKPFVSKTLQWDVDETIEANGVNVIYDLPSGESNDENSQMSYYCFNFPDENSKLNDDNLFFLSEYSLACLARNESAAEHPEIYEDDDDDVDELDDDFYPFVETRGSTVATRAEAPSVFGSTNETVKLLGNVSNKVELNQQSINNKEGQQKKQQEVINTLSNSVNGSSKNPNDATFNSKTWRSQNTIQLWDGQKHITVQLPWSQNVTNSNLPMHFCDYVTPASGWELVMNYCGEPVETIGSSGYHFFAVYNKYTGILRFFTYIPENFDANHANDHAWEVTVPEPLAQHLAYHYGLPMDRRVVDRHAIGMNSSEYNVYSSPWVDARSKDGFITPNAGWWAFDIDLSAYRPGDSAVLQRLRLQMRAWANSNVSFNSAISAKIQKTEGATAYDFNSLSGAVGMFTDVGKSIYGLYTGITTGAWGDAFKSGFGLLKNGYNIFTSARDIDAKPVVNVVNTIEGTIDTKGLISGTVNVARVTSPDMPMSRFDTQNTTLGQGVWNIKSSPVVYHLDVKFDMWFKNVVAPGATVGSVEFVSLAPFGINSKSEIKGSVCLYDPSSVEVVLNPNVFPKDQIEYVDVQTFCYVRKNSNPKTGDDYRKAFGLSTNKEWPTSKEAITYDREFNNFNCPFMDYLNTSSDKMGLQYPTAYKEWYKEGDLIYNIAGRGDDKAILEPMIFGYYDTHSSKEIKNYLPSYEVMVQLTVKLKNVNTPLTYSRTFLPEVRWLNFKQFADVAKHAEQWLTDLKKDGKTSSAKGTTYQENQLSHFKSVLEFVKPGYESLSSGITFTNTNENTTKNLSALFDGNLRTDYVSSIGDRVKSGAHHWSIEFKASRPINLKSYTLYNSFDWFRYKSEPTLWSLEAKDASGKWVQIDSRNGEQPTGPSASKTYEVKVPGKYQEFHLHVINYNGGLSSFGNFFSKYFGNGGQNLRIGELVFHEK